MKDKSAAWVDPFLDFFIGILVQSISDAFIIWINKLKRIEPNSHERKVTPNT